MTDSPNDVQARGQGPFPLVTLLLVSGAGLLYLAAQRDTGFLALLYSRTALADGEWWRQLTGHLVHFSWSHLPADIGGFLPWRVTIAQKTGGGNDAAGEAFPSGGETPSCRR